MKKQFMFIAALTVFLFAACTEKNVPNNQNNENTEQGQGDGEDIPEPKPVYYGKDAKVNTNYQPKPFSVSEDKQIIFAQGNLQYQASTNIFQFAEDQYECLGQVNLDISATNTHWIDLFGWGTSGYNGKYPYLVSREGEDYGDGINHIAQTDYDWGQYNAIRNGGNQKGLWRTLTQNECIYLFDTRNNAENLRGCAKVDTVNGYILLPDEFVLPEGLSFNGGALKWTANTYTLQQWKQMEAAGAVFLPAAGIRVGNDHYNGLNSDGDYWNATCPSGVLWGELKYFDTNGGIIWFQLNRAGATYNTFRYYGVSVRLAQDVVK